MGLENLFIRTERYFKVKDTGSQVKLDAVIKESHSSPIKITKNPVELGADITDHAIIEPKKVQIEGVVSDTPLGFEAATQLVDSATSLFGSSDSEGVTRSQQAYNELDGIKNNRELVEIQTGLKLYENMLITDIKVSQDKETSKAVFLNIDAEEIIITETEIIKLPASQLEPGNTVSQAQSNNSRGRQETTTPATDSAVNKSFAKSISGWLN